MKVVIVGSGNVATVFGRKIVQSGNEVIQVVGRNELSVQALSSSLKCGYTTNLFKINILADIYIICVSDKAINEIAVQLKLNNKIVVHTAAGVSIEVLATCSDNYGVLYPLQTLRKEITEIPVIPIVVDANNDKTRERLMAFASELSDIVSVANDEERIKLHLAAVFVNNFTNHLFTISKDFCIINKLNFNLLKPIIEETILRIKEHSPSMVQTGPAIRNDFGTIKKHEQLLEGNPEDLKLYKGLTNSILQYYHNNKI